MTQRLDGQQIKVNNLIIAYAEDYVEATNNLARANYDRDYSEAEYQRANRDSLARYIAEAVIKELGYKI